MTSRLPLRILIPVLILTTGLFIVATAWLLESRAIQQSALKVASIQLRATASFIAAEVEAALRNENPAEARAAVERASANPIVQQLYVVSPNGAIRFTGNPLAVGESFDTMPSTQALAELFAETREASSGHVEEMDAVGVLGGVFPLLMRLTPEDLIPIRNGWLYVVFDVSNELEMQRSALAARMIFWITLVSLVALVFWGLLHGLLVRRVDALVQSVRAVGKGDFGQQTEIGGRDELTELGREINGMSQRLRANTAQLSYLAEYDGLTELLNRHGIEDLINRSLDARVHIESHLALCLTDIDSLRVINDTLGHQAGDEFLQAFAELVSCALPGTLAAARVGGDEFVLLLEIASGEKLVDKAIALQREIEKFRFDFRGERFGVQASTGLVELDEKIECAADALGCADAACYFAKENSRGSYHIGSTDRFSSEQLRGQMRWVSRIQTALDEDRFRLFAQPIKSVSPTHDEGLHLEILIRMIDERGKILPPGDFLAAAERYNLVGRIDRWVVHNALDWLAQDPRMGNRISTCSINLSGRSLGDEDLLAEVSEWLTAHNEIPASTLCFEVTETTAISNLNHARSFIDRLRGMGCRFALDDFGTGLSSFAYIKRLPVDLVKIDGIFVRDMLDDPVDMAIVKAINEIAHEVGMQTVAEFVENDAILRVLRDIGVDYAQGYGIARPAPLDDVLEESSAQQREMS